MIEAHGIAVIANDTRCVPNPIPRIHINGQKTIVGHGPHNARHVRPARAHERTVAVGIAALGDPTFVVADVGGWSAGSRGWVRLAARQRSVGTPLHALVPAWCKEVWREV